MKPKPTVLFIDDDASMRKVYTVGLAMAGIPMHIVSSAEEAAKVLEEKKIDVVVTDLMMPGMTGRELAAVARQKFPNVRVLYVTGFADTLFTGVNELAAHESFVEKPFGADGLLEATRLLMFGHISDEKPPEDKRDEAGEWSDDRVRTRIVRALRKIKMA